jgi:hypothetical protein
MTLQHPSRPLHCSDSDTAALFHQGHRIHRTTAATLYGYLTIPRFRLLSGRARHTSPTAAPTPSHPYSLIG